MLFQPRQLPISQHSERCVYQKFVGGSDKKPVCWRRGKDADLEMDRVTADAKRDHTWQPQPCMRSGKFVTALLIRSCSSASQMVCRTTFNSSVVVDFGWSLFYYSGWRPEFNSLVRTNLESFNEPGIGRFSVSSAWRSERWEIGSWAVLVETA